MKKTFFRLISLVLCAALLFGGASSASAGEIAECDKAFRVSVAVNGDTATRRGFCWYSSANHKAKLTVSENGVTVKEYTVEGFEWEGNFCYKQVVDGLSAGKDYEYVIDLVPELAEPHETVNGSFSTDDADSKVDFIAYADIQASNLGNFQKGADTVAAAFRTMPSAEFMINMGDFTNDSTNEEWDFYAQTMDGINVTTTIAPVSGNHDGLGVWNWFNNLFCLDTSESVQTLNGVNYSFDYGNAHIAVLNTNDVLSISLSQLKWLKNDMNSTDKDWKIVCMHKTPYTLGKDGKWPDALYLQKSLTKVLDDCNVDLVLSGHDHQYLRTKPLTGNKLDDNGVTYVLCGTAGSKRYEVRSFLANNFLKPEFIEMLNIQKNGYGNYWNGTDWSSTRETNIGGCFNTVSIDGGTLTFNSYILQDDLTEQGVAAEDRPVTNTDSFTLTKEEGLNKITFTGDNTTSEAEFYLGVIPSFCALAAYTFSIWLPKFFIMLPNLIKVYVNEGTF